MRSVRFAFAASVAFFVATSTFAATVRPTGGVAPNDILVKVRAGASAADVKALERLADADDTKRLSKVRGGTVYRMHSRSKSAEALAAALQHNPNIEYAEPNFILGLASMPNDPSYAQLWGLKNIGQSILGITGSAGADIDAEPAWGVTTGSASVVVGVVDTGIDYTHPDLAANMWRNPGGKGNPDCATGTFGFNAITGTCDPKDDNNHGTHVAGTIGAVGNNGTGITGVNWTVSLMALKFLSAGGYGTTADAIAAIDFAVQAKIDGVNVRVLSNSWGGGPFSKALLDEINKANEHDILFVAAAGNDYGLNNDNFPHYPSNYATPNMISVAATDNRDFLAYFSNYGPNTVHLGAPGVDVLSTIRNGGYAYYDGTSMATPHVAGVAALMLAKTPALSTADLKSALLAAVDPIASLASKTITGGRLNAAKAVGATATPDFYLAVTPVSRTVTLGNSTTFGITVTLANGFAGNVALSLKGLPANATAELSPANTTSTATLTVTTSATTPATTSILTITGTGGGISRSVNTVLQTVASLPVAPCPDFRSWDAFTSTSVNALAVADFNGDGKNDIAAAETDSNRVRVSFGAGFSASRFVAVGTTPLGVVAADFNGDGSLDLATANAGTHNISVSLGDGEGLFEAAEAYAAGTSPFAIAAGDFNRDGRIDLAVANNGSRNVSILLGDGEGGFASAVSYGTGSGPYSIAVADVDRDGDSDLAVANFNDGTISILRGNGNGTFQTAINVAAGQKPSSVAAGDFDRDGVPDLAVADYAGSKVFVLTGNGDGTFAAATNITVGDNPNSIAVGHFNEDGRPDLVTANSESNTLSVLLATGDAQFTLADAIDAFSTTVAAVGDFDGDGKDDIAANDVDWWSGTSRVLIHRNYGTCSTNCGTPASATSHAVSDAGPVATADFNGDGIVDVATVNPSANSVSISKGDGDGTFTTGVTVPAGTSPQGIAAADFDRDGKADLAVASSGSNEVAVLRGNGDGTFASAVKYAAGLTPRAIAIGDFDRDGILDLAVAARGADAVSILLGNGNGSFQAPVPYAAGDDPEAVASGDFDGDGDADLAVANSADGTISILLGDGDGTFSAATDLAVGTTPSAVIAADLNEDGQLDLAVANAGSNEVSISSGNGDGTFDDAVDHAVGTTPKSLAAADWNRDGVLDLITANSGSHDVSIVLGIDLGGHQPAGDISVGTGPASIAAADLDRDGKPDLVVSNSGSDTVSVVRNTCPQVDLAITKLHIGNFTQGATGKDYTITVTNTGAVSTSGVVTVQELVPGGLTVTGMTGTGWTCTLPAAKCTRSDALAAGASYPPLTITVNVSISAPATVTNQVTVSGGGEVGSNTANNTASDPTTIDQITDLRLTKSHTDSFTQGATGRVYKLLVRNAGGKASNGTVTVTDTLPAGLTATSMSGTGWSCNVGALNCTRGDALAGGKSYPAITLVVSVAANAPSHVVNNAAVAGGGDSNASNNSAADPTAIWRTQTCGSFGVSGYFNTGNFVQSMAVADFDEDGKQDIAAGHYSNISILLGNGDGTLDPRVGYSAPGTDGDIVTGDVDADGDYDLVSGGYSQIVVLLGNGDGTFGAAATFATGTSYINGQFSLGDVTGDGAIDVVFASGLIVAILPGNGDGSFRSVINVALQQPINNVTILDADMNGTADLAVAMYDGVAVLLGNGDGTFGTATFYDLSSTTNSIAVGDFNGDQKPDLAVLSYYGYGVFVLSGVGDGTFQTPLYYGTDYGSSTLLVIDINGDAKLDLLVGADNAFSVLLGNGNGTFQTRTSYYVGYGGRSIAVGDFNADGKPDLAHGQGYDVRIMPGGCPDLSITKTHNGNFRGGQDGVYTISVQNVGAYTSGTVTVKDVLPDGLTAQSISGSYDWDCTLSTLTCTRSSTLYPGETTQIWVSVSVSRAAPATVTNTATVSGGGDTNPANNSASDPTTIVHSAELSIKKTHVGTFTVGGNGTYTITVGNVGSGPTAGAVTVTEYPPAEMSLLSMSGTGWTCDLGARTCTRSDVLSATQTYPPISVTVTVLSGTTTPVTNYAGVWGGGDTLTKYAADPTAILIAPTVTATAASPTVVNVTWPVLSSATTYEVWRSGNNVQWALAGTTISNIFQDNARTPNTTYLYKVRGLAGSVTGPFSGVDFATTTLFSDDPIVPGSTRVRAAHVHELRTAINGYRAAAGLAPASFTDPSLSSGALIKGAHWAELYQALNPARTAFGLSQIANNTAPTVVIKATDIINLRNAVK